MVFQRDELNRVVCNIRTPDGKGNEEVGTAIFIERENRPYLLTASHVANGINPQSVVVLSDDKGNPQSVSLSIILGGSTFVHHTTADIAKAEIQVNVSNKPLLQNRSFPYTQIETNPVNLSKDLQLTSVGFPLGLGALGSKFSPLTFRTFVSSPKITFPRFDNKVLCDFIILEQPSIGGYSGGPLFELGYIISGAMTSTTGPTKLHGIVHGTITDSTGGKLAAITPTSYLNGWL